MNKFQFFVIAFIALLSHPTHVQASSPEEWGEFYEKENARCLPLLKAKNYSDFSCLEVAISQAKDNKTEIIKIRRNFAVYIRNSNISGNEKSRQLGSIFWQLANDYENSSPPAAYAYFFLIESEFGQYNKGDRIYNNYLIKLREALTTKQIDQAKEMIQAYKSGGKLPE